MSRPTRDSETQTAELESQLSIDTASSALSSPPESQWIRSQLPLIYKILDRLDGDELAPRKRMAALANLKRPLMEMVKALSRLDAMESYPKVTTLSPSPTPAQRILERMCRNLDHLLVTLDRSRFQAGSTGDERRWTVRQLLRFLGYQVEYGVLWDRPWPTRTWQRLHDLFEYVMERRDLDGGAGHPGGGGSFDPAIAYKRLLLLSLAPQLRGTRRLEQAILDNLARWASQTRLVEPASRLGEYGLIVVETSLDRPPRFRAPPADDPWRGWVLEPPAEFLAFAGIQRPMLALEDPSHSARVARGGGY